MKNWLTQSVGLCTVAALALTGCKKDDMQATLTPSNSPTLTASTNTVVLQQANSTQTAVTFNWTPIASFAWSGVDNPYTPAVAYQFQIDKQGNNFAAPVTISAGAGPATAVSVGDLNAALVNLGITPNTATPLEVRLNANYASNAQLNSPVVALTATAFAFCAQPQKAWSIIGPAGPGWSNDYTMTYDCDAKTFNYTGPLTADQFKFRFGKHWTTNLGGAGPTVPLAKDGNNLVIASSGTYTVTLYNATDSTKLATAYYTVK